MAMKFDCVSYQLGQVVVLCYLSMLCPVISGCGHQKWSDMMDNVCEESRRELQAKVTGQNSNILCPLIKCQDICAVLCNKSCHSILVYSVFCTKHAGL